VGRYVFADFLFLDAYLGGEWGAEMWDLLMGL